jgi:phospholipid/cholesterol/gamma-HCH transport system permease protein
LEIIGRRAIGALRGLGGLGHFAADTVVEVADHVTRRRAPFHARLLFEQTRRVGVGSIPLVALVSLFLGLSTAILAGYQLARLGAVESVPTFVAVSFTREMGALLTGIVVAARSGAAFTAELGTMNVSEEVDAIEGMGIGALRYLVAPRVLASVLMLPSLTVVSNLAGIFAGALVAKAQWGMSLPHFSVLAMESLVTHDIVAGLIKSVLFGLVIGGIACYKGLKASQGATGVGLATTSSVVMSVSSVIGCDTLCNVVLVRIWP